MRVRPAEADIGALLEALAEAGVEHIVVGGVAALLHGAPLPTRDLDIVPRQSADNLDRLMIDTQAFWARVILRIEQQAQPRTECPHHG